MRQSTSLRLHHFRTLLHAGAGIYYQKVDTVITLFIKITKPWKQHFKIFNPARLLHIKHTGKNPDMASSSCIGALFRRSGGGKGLGQISVPKNWPTSSQWTPPEPFGGGCSAGRMPLFSHHATPWCKETHIHTYLGTHESC